ncbi:MAG: DUF1631 family protein [Variovorax sp.]
MSTARPRDKFELISHETRERFVAATGRAVAPIAAAIRERLRIAADQVTTARLMQQHRDDLMAFQAREVDWVLRSQASWNEARIDPAVAEAAPTSSTGNEPALSLLGEDSVESGILASRVGLAVQHLAGNEFTDLRRRMLELDRLNEFAPEDVLRPEALAKVLVETWLATGLSKDLWVKVQDMVTEKVPEAIVAGYKEANAQLIAQGVMPKIDLKQFVRRAASAGAGGVASTGFGADSGMDEPVGQGWARSAPGHLGESDSELDRLMRAPAAQAMMAARQQAMARGAGEARASAGSAGAASTDATRHRAMMPTVVMGAGGGAYQTPAAQRGQGVLLSLRRFLTARLGTDIAASPGPGQSDGAANGPPGSAAAHGRAGGAASPAFMAAIADAYVTYNQHASPYVDGASAVRQIAADMRERTAQLKRQAPTTADKATVEVVALMFQAILAEERIPFSARVWFARLQMPVLRVAIAEPEFFATAQHPARMLIDRMGSCALGFDASAITGSAFENEVRRVVQVIEQYPETGQRVFKLVYDEFVAFLSKYLTQSESAQRVMSVAQQVEEKETHTIQYTIELRKMLNDIPVRNEIRDFLFKVWAEVLAVAALRYGGQDQRTVILKRAASELVWAASAKPNRADRTRVIQGLPRLLLLLREGMALLGLKGEQQEEHIKVIGDTLADAFMSKTEAIAPAQIEAMAERLAHIEDLVGDGESAGELTLDAQSIELLLGVDAASIEVIADTGGSGSVSEAMKQWAANIEIGTWFRLDHNSRVTQVQFMWRSERKQLHLFASADGRSYLIQARRLAAYLQANLLVPIEEEALTARATRDALAKLDANPERLLN